MCNIKTYTLFLCLSLVGFLPSLYGKDYAGAPKAPAYPLITIDPYISAWSVSDTLYHSAIRHWSGKKFPLQGILTVDGQPYRFMGKTENDWADLLELLKVNETETSFTCHTPSAQWNTLQFDDTNWKKGIGSYGKPGMPYNKTTWDSDKEDIWIRREFTLDDNLPSDSLYLQFTIDKSAEFYLNGEKLTEAVSNWKTTRQIPMDKQLRRLLRKGKNVLCAHVHSQDWAGVTDFGITSLKKAQEEYPVTALQQSVEVLPTQTVYRFTAGAATLKLTFTSPLLMNNLSLMCRPVGYIHYEIDFNDNQEHSAEIAFSLSPRWCLNYPAQPFITQERQTSRGMTVLTAGSQDQKILGKKGDDVRIDWGYLYLTSSDPDSRLFIDNSQNLCYQHTMKKQQEGTAIIGYDDIYSIEYFHTPTKGFWTHEGDIDEILYLASRQEKEIYDQCATFDQRLLKQATKAGGQEYAELCSMVYRQVIAAHKLIQSPHGNLLFLSKENFSNGSVGTVDITYPSIPLFLYGNLELCKALLNPIYEYCEHYHWNKPFPPHDVGTYPIANGQTYGADMPVEESGNMLILTAAICQKEKSTKYAMRHWSLLKQWADYLVGKGVDLDNQLCTDDFAGHSAHNCNLSIKSIIGIAAFGKMAVMNNDKETGRKYLDKAKEMAAQWEQMGLASDHYRLAFDQPESWSQKYNLIWDKYLGLNLFSPEVYQKEIAFYLKKMNCYGLPLDSRATYTKADWILWSAALADKEENFRELIAPLYKYATETQSRVPMSDWYETTTGNMVDFQARSVLGAFFIKIILDDL